MFNFTSFHDNLILYLVYNIILKDEFYLQKKKIVKLWFIVCSSFHFDDIFPCRKFKIPILAFFVLRQIDAIHR